jgi:hypothetical protein
MATKCRPVLMAGLASTPGPFMMASGAASVGQPRPVLDGELRFDEMTQQEAADDFGHIVHRTPDGVLLPASDRDIASTIRWAAARGSKFAARGQRHSVFGPGGGPSGWMR